MFPTVKHGTPSGRHLHALPSSLCPIEPGIGVTLVWYQEPWTRLCTMGQQDGLKGCFLLCER